MISADPDIPSGGSAAQPPPSDAPPTSTDTPRDAGNGAGRRGLSRWARVLLGVTTAVLAVALAFHLLMMFLGAAPSNTVSQQLSTPLNWWTEPWLEQNWQLFAPNPMSENLRVDARARTATGQVSDWIDVSASDYASVLHNPMPSHEIQNELRRAWYGFQADAPQSGIPNTTDGRLLQEYLRNIALVRLTGKVAGPITAIELRGTTTPLATPNATTTPRSTVQQLPWWTVPPGTKVAG